jgi:hypothetical protein
MTDPISWLLVALAMILTAMAVGSVGATLAAGACGADGTLVLCTGAPDRLLVLVEALLAGAGWCLVGMRAARSPR